MSGPDAAAEAEERAYLELIARMRERVAAAVPPGGVVAVISHGDERMLRIDDRDAFHFPQSSTGLYAGYHPADGAEARDRLVELRERGTDYFVVPATSAWWLDYYTELRNALAAEAELVVDEPETCLIFALRPMAEAVEDRSTTSLAARRAATQVAGLVEALLPAEAGVVLVGPGAGEVELGKRRSWRIEETPERQVTIPDALSKLFAARASGGRYLVVLKPADRRRWPDSRLTEQLAEGHRPLFSQRLADGFELAGLTVAGGL
jgi:hypothetical protein